MSFDYALPSGWKWSSLEKVVLSEKNAIADGPFGSNLKSSDYVESGVPVLQGKNITNNIFQWKDVRYISEAKAEELKRSQVKVGDLLMIKIGSIGYSALIDCLHGFECAVIPANMAKLSLDETVIYPKYLRFWLTSIDAVRGLQGMASKTAQPAISLAKIKPFPVPLPPLETQKQIATVLEKADQLRKDCQQMEQELNSLAQSVFIDMFGDPVTNPKIFEVTKLKDLVSVLSGATPSKSNDSFWVGDVPWVSPKDMKVPELYDAIDHVNEITFSETNLKSIPLNSILIVVRGMILAHTVPLAITRKKLAINQDIKALIVKSESITSEFLLAALSNMHAHLLGIVSTAAHGTKRIDMADLLNIRIIVPSLEKQEEYIKAIQVIRELLANQKAEAALHESNFKALMQKAFKGELNL